MALTLYAEIIVRNDTAAGWSGANPTLALGEMGLETDTFLFKKGDGSTAWNSLPYMFVIPPCTGKPVDSPVVRTARFDVASGILYIYNGVTWVGATFT